jgi:hypothetical protein
MAAGTFKNAQPKGAFFVVAGHSAGHFACRQNKKSSLRAPFL